MHTAAHYLALSFALLPLSALLAVLALLFLPKLVRRFNRRGAWKITGGTRLNLRNRR